MTIRRNRPQHPTIPVGELTLRHRGMRITAPIGHRHIAALTILNVIHHPTVTHVIGDDGAGFTTSNTTPVTFVDIAAGDYRPQMPRHMQTVAVIACVVGVALITLGGYIMVRVLGR